MLNEMATFLKSVVWLTTLTSTLSAPFSYTDDRPTMSPFDIVLVKEHRPDDEAPMNMGWRGGSYFASDAPLEVLLMNAYSLRENHIKGLKGWENTKRWDILAKWSDWDEDQATSLTDEVKQSTLQGLLSSAFKLKIHLETREESGYELVVASSGTRLKEHVERHEIVDAQSPGTWRYGAGTIDIVGSDVKGFLFPLENKLGHPVLDRTGLTGSYDLHLRWTELARADSAVDAGPSLATVLKEQAGLELRPAKVPVEVLVIDNAMQPEAP
jgi:uncharacterized protein (TIGR03435 family)